MLITDLGRWARRAALVGLLVALCAAAAGCQREPALVDIEGVVSKEGKPLPNLRVVFYPDHETGTTGPESSGATDQAGRYRVKTTKDGAGAVAGKHRVCLVDLEALRAPERSRIPPEYGSVSTTPLRDVEVKSGQSLDFALPGGKGPRR